MINITSFLDLYENENILYETIKNPDNLKKIDRNINKKKHKVDRFISQLENKLKRNKIDTLALRKSVKNYINTNIKNKLHSDNPKNIGKNIAENLPGIFGTKKTQTELEKSQAISSGLVKAVLLFIIILYIHILLFEIFFIIGIPVELAFIILAIFIAPFTEETAKYLSIKHNATGQFWIVFNAYEFFSYVTAMLTAGVPLTAAITTRTLTLLMHTITTYVMYVTRKENIKSQQNPDSKVGLAAGIMIHMFWNIKATLIYIGI